MADPGARVAGDADVRCAAGDRPVTARRAFRICDTNGALGTIRPAAPVADGTEQRWGTSGARTCSTLVRSTTPNGHRGEHQVRSARFRYIAVAVTVGLFAVTAACSRSDNGTSTEAGSGTSSTTAGSNGAPGNGQFGTLTDPVCGPAPSGGSTPAATGTQVGLTSDTITLGTISDVGYSGAPGLNQELFDASDVFASWCNSLGGLNGHKIKIDKLDAKITEYKSVIQKACEQDFALVGGGGAFDDTGQTA